MVSVLTAKHLATLLTVWSAFPLSLSLLTVSSVFTLSHQYSHCTHCKTFCQYSQNSQNSHCLVIILAVSSVFLLYSLQNILPEFSVFSLPHIVSILTATNGHCFHCQTPCGVATMRRLLKIIGLFCRISSLL